MLLDTWYSAKCPLAGSTGVGIPHHQWAQVQSLAADRRPNSTQEMGLAATAGLYSSPECERFSLTQVAQEWSGHVCACPDHMGAQSLRPPGRDHPAVGGRSFGAGAVMDLQRSGDFTPDAALAYRCSLGY